jgi:DnaJ-class molecular chaperone
VNDNKCPLCKGSGEISVHKKLNVKIPAGIKKGAKIRVTNEGNKGYNGGKNGDLYLLIEIEETPFFKYEGLNVLCEVPITPFEAVLGANIEIPTLCGNISMKIPQNTTTGQKFRLSEQGVYDENKRQKGDQIVTVKIVIPKNLSNKEIELYEQLKNISTTNVRENLLND